MAHNLNTGYKPMLKNFAYRNCALCDEQMIGIVDGGIPVRLVCEPCGGKPTTPEEREELAAA